MHFGFQLIIDLLILCLVIYVAFWIINKAGLADPWRTIIVVALAIFGLMWLGHVAGLAATLALVGGSRAMWL